jgi:hypothetical protein
LTAISITYDAPPTLSRFMDSDAFVRCCVGPLGSGKSSGCIMEILRRAVEQAPSPDGIRHTRFAVIRNTRPQLEDTTRKSFEQWVPDALGTWNESDFSFHMRFADVDCEVLFRALDRPADVRKVLSLELTGAYINEAREIAKEVVDGLQGRVGRYPAKKDGGATWFGVWMDTNPWHVGHWGYKLFASRPEGHEVFEQPSGLSPEAENVANLPPGYYARLAHGKDSEWVDEYLRGLYPAADKGSVYGDLIAKLEAGGWVTDFEHPKDGVYVTFDLGVSDSTSIWWWRLTSRNGATQVDLVDWYEASGEGAAHYFEVLRGGTPVGCDRARAYKLQRILLPHDARARTFQTGVSTVELFLKAFPGLVSIGAELGLEDGIGAARWMLEQPMRVHTRCADGLERLRAYRFVWDEDRKVYSKKPLHDFASHTADGFRYIACEVQAAYLATRKPVPETKRQQVSMASGLVTIDDTELFTPSGYRAGGGRI